MTEAHGCEQLAQGCYAAFAPSIGIESTTGCYLFIITELCSAASYKWKQGVALTVRKVLARRGVGRPTACPPATLQTTTDVNEQINTGPIVGPVTNNQ